METKIVNVSITDCTLLITELEHLQTLPSISLAMFSNKNLKRLRETVDVVKDSFENAIKNVEGYDEFKRNIDSQISAFRERISDLEDENSEEAKAIIEEFSKIEKEVHEKYESTVSGIQKIKDEYSSLVKEKHPVEFFIISSNSLPQDIDGKSIETLMSVGLID